MQTFRLCLPMSALLVIVSHAVVAFGGEAAAAGRYHEVVYAASAEPGELALGVTYVLWIPAGDAPLRGVIVHQHGCGTGACQGGATAAYDLHWQALAKKWNCALLGPSYHQQDGENCRLWCDPRNGSAKTFVRALDDFAAQAERPELRRVPWCLWGHSGGAFWASIMQTLYPERIAAIWFRSGGAFPYWERGEIEKPDVSPAALAIPSMQNPGGKEKGHERFKIAYDGGLAMFKAYRAQGSPMGFAADPRTAHECGDSRYLAIPWFDACLALRLPPADSTDRTLRPINIARGRTAWLPSDRLARLCDEYVKTGFVDDRTPPPAPFDLVARRTAEGAIALSWNAEADFESGLGGFIVLRDGAELAVLPEKPIGKFGKPLFQTMSFHDTPEKPLPTMTFTDAAAPAEALPKYRIVAVNAAGLKSEPSAVGQP